MTYMLGHDRARGHWNAVAALALALIVTLDTTHGGAMAERWLQQELNDHLGAWDDGGVAAAAAEAEAEGMPLLTGAGRALRWTGDMLGKYDAVAPSAAGAPANATRPPASMEKKQQLQDHAHFFGAAQALTRWAETTFALTARAHAELLRQPAGAASACVYDGKRCLFNPASVGREDFPAPKAAAEKTLKRFALEAATCRGSSDRPGCHMDTNCDWDDRTGACFLAHDPLQDFMAAIAACRDTLYSADARRCWRRRPDASAWRPCGEAVCKMYPKGSDGGGGEGIPEDRCMPEGQGSLKAKEMFNMLKRRYGDAFSNPLEPAADAAAATGTDAPASQPAVFVEGYGSCDAAALHHAFATACRHTDSKDACRADKRCYWLTKVLAGEHCVLHLGKVVELLLGSRPFTRAVLQAEKACKEAASSQEACSAVKPALQTEAGGRR